MNITEVTIKMETERPNPNIRAYASFVLDDAFRVTRLRVIQDGTGRYRVMMPSRSVEGPAVKPGTPTYADAAGIPYHYRDIAFPVSGKARWEIDRAVLECYLRAERDGLDRATYELGRPAARMAV